MYKYRGFGLQIASEIEFPELLPADFADANVTIVVGKTPDNLIGEVQVKKAFSSISQYEYLLNIRNICSYYACFGNKIIAEPLPGVDEQSVRLFLLGTVMAAILYQRGDIPMHASAIVKDGRLILFAGNSGAGKSTLLAHLIMSGYEIFTDDICVLKHHADSGLISGLASYPMIKLWEDAIDKLDNTTYTRDFKVRPQLPKYGQFFYDNFNDATLPVDKIFVLCPKNTADGIVVNKPVNVQAFKLLEKQVYKYGLISHTELRALYFATISRLTNQAQVFEVIRPLSDTGVAQLSDMLQKLF